MTQLSRLFVFTFVAYFATFPTASACSIFQMKSGSETFVAKNYDWRFGDGFIVYNPANLQKTSLSLNPDGATLGWQSKHSSITFNQYGVEFPNGGLNDAGLSVEVLWLDESVFPSTDDKPTFNELQWIQYALDTQKTTDGVLKTLDTVRIEPIYAKVHYFICDSQKKCAVVEFLGGAKAIGKYENTYEVLTNSNYRESMDYLKEFANFGGRREVVWETYASLDRFVRLNEMLRRNDNSATIRTPVANSFKVLDTTKRPTSEQGNTTQWQIVYDTKTLIVHFKTAFSNNAAGTISLRDFPKGCQDRHYFDLSSKVRGDLKGKFLPLTEAANYQLVKTSIRKVIPKMPETAIKVISSAPFTYRCQAK